MPGGPGALPPEAQTSLGCVSERFRAWRVSVRSATRSLWGPAAPPRPTPSHAGAARFSGRRECGVPSSLTSEIFQTCVSPKQRWQGCSPASRPRVSPPKSAPGTCKQLPEEVGVWSGAQCLRTRLDRPPAPRGAPTPPRRDQAYRRALSCSEHDSGASPGRVTGLHCPLCGPRADLGLTEQLVP